MKILKAILRPALGFMVLPPVLVIGTVAIVIYMAVLIVVFVLSIGESVVNTAKYGDSIGGVPDSERPLGLLVEWMIG